MPSGFTNEGQIELLSFEADDHPPPSATLSVSPGTLLNAAEGVIQSNAEPTTKSILKGSLVNSGTVQIGNPTGQFTITGIFHKYSEGRLEVDLAGSTPGVDYDQLVVGGAVTLGGTLSVSINSLFAAARGRSL